MILTYEDLVRLFPDHDVVGGEIVVGRKVVGSLGEVALLNDAGKALAASRKADTPAPAAPTTPEPASAAPRRGRPPRAPIAETLG